MKSTSFESAPRPQLLEILKLLPKTNCRQCGDPTCRVFAARVAEGAKGIDACPSLDTKQRQALEGCMKKFNLGD